MIHCGLLADDWTYGVSTYSKHPELAYLFSQYMNSPAVSLPCINDPAGFHEPFRTCHFTDPLTWKWFGKDFVDMMWENLTDWYAPGIHFLGTGEYSDVLDRELTEAYTGLKTPEDALNAAAEAWEDLTESIGREEQIKDWLFLKKGFGKEIKRIAPELFE